MCQCFHTFLLAQCISRNIGLFKMQIPNMGVVHLLKSWIGLCGQINVKVCSLLSSCPEGPALRVLYLRVQCTSESPVLSISFHHSSARVCLNPKRFFAEAMIQKYEISNLAVDRQEVNRLVLLANFVS